MSKLTPKQVNSIKRKLGILLCRQGEDFLKSAFHIKPVVFDSRDVMNFLRDITGLPAGTISLSDRKYYLTDWETFKQIIEVDWTESYKYCSDFFDCDNSSFLFASRMGMMFKLNSASVCYGMLNYSDKSFGHAFNLIITHNNIGGLEARIFEPMTDEWCLIEKEKPSMIGYKEYKILWIIMF